MGGRPLSLEEQAAIERDMEAIVLGSHLFKSLDDAGRKDLIESGFVMRFDAGDMILRQGDPGDTMFLVLEGTVRVETETPGGTIQLAELGRGACLGEVSVLTRGPRTATVSALTPVTTVTFARHRVERLLAQHPRVRALLEALIAGRARDAVDKILGQ
jgi:CRP/FNR family transcriptional regulator, cyclic AMP receptor protein